MQQQNPAVKYGLIGAIILVAVAILFQIVALSYLKSVANEAGKFSVGKIALFSIGSLVLIVGIFIVCIVKAIKDYRNLNTDYTYRKLVGQGLLVTLIIVAVSTGCSLLYNNVISPETKQKTLELSRQIYQQMDIPEDQKAKVLEKMDHRDPVRELLTSLGLTLLLGMIISLISASVMNRRDIINNPNQLR